MGGTKNHTAVLTTGACVLPACLARAVPAAPRVRVATGGVRAAQAARNPAFSMWNAVYSGCRIVTPRARASADRAGPRLTANAAPTSIPLSRSPTHTTASATAATKLVRADPERGHTASCGEGMDVGAILSRRRRVPVLDRAGAVRGAVHRTVVHHDQHAIERLVHVELENVCAVFERLVVGEQGVLGSNAPAASVRDAEHLVAAKHLLWTLALRLSATHATFAAHCTHSTRTAGPARARLAAGSAGACPYEPRLAPLRRCRLELHILFAAFARPLAVSKQRSRATE